MKNRTRLNDDGFTLIEVMVTILIIGLMGAMVVGVVLPQFEQAKTQKAIADIRTLETNLDRYRLAMGTYPSIEQGLDALVSEPGDLSGNARYPAEGFIRQLPQDPWGYDYQYVFPGERGMIDVYSYGADGQPGGEGLNADIGNWTAEN